MQIKKENLHPPLIPNINKRIKRQNMISPALLIAFKVTFDDKQAKIFIVFAFINALLKFVIILNSPVLRIFLITEILQNLNLLK